MSKNNRPLFALKILALTIALALSGCNRKAVFSHYSHTDIQQWASTDTIAFDIPVNKGRHFAEELNLRAVSSYPYQAITVYIRQTTTSGLDLTDTATISIYNEKGRLTGKNLSRRQYAVSLRDVSICDSDTLHVAIHHIMKDRYLKGISDIGITLTEL